MEKNPHAILGAIILNCTIEEFENGLERDREDQHVGSDGPFKYIDAYREAKRRNFGLFYGMPAVLAPNMDRKWASITGRLISNEPELQNLPPKERPPFRKTYPELATFLGYESDQVTAFRYATEGLKAFRLYQGNAASVKVQDGSVPESLQTLLERKFPGMAFHTIHDSIMLPDTEQGREAYTFLVGKLLESDKEWLKALDLDWAALEVRSLGKNISWEQAQKWVGGKGGIDDVPDIEGE